MTSIPEIDVNILIYLSDDDLIHLSRVNKYFHSLYYDDFHWRRRIAHELNFIHGDKRHPSLTWKEWYFFWLRHNYAHVLIKELKLTSEQCFISLSSEGDNLYLKTEVFQSLRITLRKALLSNDESLFNYYIERYRTYVNILVNANNLTDIDLPNYPDLVDIALRIGNKDLAKEFIDDLFRIYTNIRLNIADDGNFITICRILGQHCNYYYVKIVDIFRENGMVDEILFSRYAFLEGLITRYHNKEAVEFLEFLDREYNLEYELFFEVAYRANNHYMLNMMKDKIMERITDYSKKYNQSHEKISLLYEKNIINADNYLQVASCCDDFDISNYLKYHLNGHENIKRKQGKRRETLLSTLDFRNSPLETLKNVFDNLENEKEKSSLITFAIKFGRYDFVLGCGFKELSPFIVRNVVFSMVDSCYRDLTLYVLIQTAKYQPIIYNQAKDILLDLTNIPEILNLVRELFKIPFDKLSETNFYSLLEKTLF